MTYQELLATLKGHAARIQTEQDEARKNGHIGYLIGFIEGLPLPVPEEHPPKY